MGLKVDSGKLEQYLVSLTRKASNTFMDEALEAGSKPILNEIEKNVPEDTGELKASMGTIKKSGSGTSRTHHIGSTSDKREVVERCYYQEHGNSSMLGTKFLKKSHQNAKTEAIEAISDTILDKLL